MEQLANHDSLTGVRNKTAYNSMILQIADDKKVGLAIVDLNYLKRINDNHGHDKGDLAIKNLCSHICNVFSHSPVFRIGGDEFVVVLHGYDLEHHDSLIEKFNTMVEENIAKDGVVVSLGHSEFIPGKDTTMRSVFSRADVQMYERKRYLKSLGAKTR